MTLTKSSIYDTVFFTGLIISIMALPFSVSICHLGILVIAINWIVQGDWHSKWHKLKRNPLALFFVGFLCVQFIGIFYSNDTVNGWSNLEKKITFGVLPIVLATSALPSKRLRYLLNVFILSCFIASLVCLAGSSYRILTDPQQTFLNFGESQPTLLLENPMFSNNWQQFSYIALASVIKIHPTYFSIYLIFCIALLLNQYTRNNNRTLSITLIAYFIVFLALLSTRVTFLVILASLLVYCIYFFLRTSHFKLKAIRTTAIFIMLFIMLSALNPISFYRGFQEIKSTNFQLSENRHYTKSTELRLSLWLTGLKTAAGINFFTGAGAGDTKQEMQKTLSEDNISNILNTADPHNQFLNTFIASGLLGLLLLLGCILIPLRKAWLERDLIHLTFIALILLASTTESFLESQKGIVFFVLFQCLFTFSRSNKLATSNSHIS